MGYLVPPMPPRSWTLLAAARAIDDASSATVTALRLIRELELSADGATELLAFAKSLDGAWKRPLLVDRLTQALREQAAAQADHNRTVWITNLAEYAGRVG